MKIKKIPLYGVVLFIIIVVNIVYRIFFADYSIDTIYNFNDYFNDSEIKQIIVSAGDTPEKMHIVKKIENKFVITDFKKGLNNSQLSASPNHIIYSGIFEVQVLLENGKQYNLHCYFRSEVKDLVFISDPNHLSFMQSNSLRTWFIKNEIY